ncbi:hypothetical protein F5Y04DRAFT_241016 [Hypomontagnella monticulosa]|nr:hypothetical protein F5Y04DRAFT_241016 [Hypomontagnella monticulosa]
MSMSRSSFLLIHPFLLCTAMMSGRSSAARYRNLFPVRSSGWRKDRQDGVEYSPTHENHTVLRLIAFLYQEQ